MGLARNLSKFKPNSDGLVEANDIAPGAIQSGSVTATASGSIGAGKVVTLNSNGTVSECAGTFHADYVTGSVTATTNHYGFNGIVVDDTNNKVIFGVYPDTGTPTNFNFVYDLATNTIASAGRSNFYPAMHIEGTSNVIFGKYNADDGVMTACIGSVSGTTLSLGSETTLFNFTGIGSSGVLKYSLFRLPDGKYAWSFARVTQFSGTYPLATRLVIFSVSGTSITVHNTQDFGTDEVIVSAGVDPVSGYIVALTGNTYFGSNHKTKLYSYASNTLTQVSSRARDTGVENQITGSLRFTSEGRAIINRGAYLSVSGTTVVNTWGGITYNFNAVSPNGTMAVVFPTGNATYSFAPFIFKDGSYISSGSLLYSGANQEYKDYVISNKYVVYASNASNSNQIRFDVKYAPNSTAYSWFGVNTTGVTNGQTATVTVLGGTNENQASLISGAAVYTTGNGSITMSASPIKVGVAQSTTKVFVKGNA